MLIRVKLMRFLFLLLLVSSLFYPQIIKGQAREARVQITNLNDGEDTENFNAIREAFKKRNPGYDMEYLSDAREVESRDYTRVLFVQAIEGVTNQDVEAQAVITGKSGSREESAAIVGDILILQEGEKMETDVETGFLAFKVPEPPENELPSFIRPDWDPNITDVPGGCATDIDAYRRILLTWKKEVGEYIYHAINAPRVRIYDSFSHYHPVQGGFDEFYLVQMVKPGAK